MIGQVMARRLKVLVLDEPTAAFSNDSVDRLFDVVRRVAGEGTAVIYVSHRLGEVLEIASRIVVMSQGSVVADRPSLGVSRAELSDLIAGQHVESVERSRDRVTVGAEIGSGDADSPVFRCMDIRTVVGGDGSNFEVRRGEVLGLTGLVGSGRSTLLNIICGLARSVTGEMWLDDRQYGPRSLRDAIRKGIAYVPEDRTRNSIFSSMSVLENMTLVSLSQNCHSRLPILAIRRERERGVGRLASFNIKYPSTGAPIETLSGGNQQKVVIARWLSREVQLVVFDEPTEGVDVSGREDIYALIRDLASTGKAVLVCSSDVEEVVSIADRIMIMRDQVVRDVVQGSEISVDRITRACLSS